ATALCNLGSFSDALPLFVRALDLDPALLDAWSGKGMALGALGRHEAALLAFDQALALEPDCAAVWYSEGQVCRFSGRLEGRDPWISRLAPPVKGVVAAGSSPGVDLMRSELYEDAVRSYDRVIDEDRQSAVLWCNRGIVVVEMGMH